MVMAPEWLERMDSLVAEVDAPVYAASYDVLRQLTGFNVHRGALAAFHRKPLPDVDDLLDGSHRVVVLEDLVSHTNLGAVFRCAAALGVDAVVLSPSCADPLYRRSVRVSMGAVFTLPYARAEAWPAVLERVAARGFSVVGLTPAADALDLDHTHYGDNDRVALLFGAEGPGLSPEALSLSDVRVRIPMAGGVDSLNVAAAAAVTFWALAHRPPPPSGPPPRAR